MLGNEIPGGPATLGFAWQSLALIVFYMAIAWLPLRLLISGVQFARRRRVRRFRLEQQDEADAYHIGMEILPPM